MPTLADDSAFAHRDKEMDSLLTCHRLDLSQALIFAAPL